ILNLESLRYENIFLLFLKFQKVFLGAALNKKTAEAGGFSDFLLIFSRNRKYLHSCTIVSYQISLLRKKPYKPMLTWHFFVYCENYCLVKMIFCGKVIVPSKGGSVGFLNLIPRVFCSFTNLM